MAALAGDGGDDSATGTADPQRRGLLSTLSIALRQLCRIVVAAADLDRRRIEIPTTKFSSELSVVAGTGPDHVTDHRHGCDRRRDSRGGVAGQKPRGRTEQLETMPACKRLGQTRRSNRSSRINQHR